MRRVALAFSIVLLWACAQRDNPYDPVNFSGSREIDTNYHPPEPSGTIRVVLPDSVKSRDSRFYANIGAALPYLNPGDTLYVQGGRTYAIPGVLNLSHGGARLLPVVIRSFGGEARILARAAVPNCLRIDLGGGWVHISGFAFVGSQGPAIIGSGVEGDIQIDSCRVDSSGSGIDLRNMYGKVRLNDISMTDNVQNPPLTFLSDTGLDTARLTWK